MRERGKDGIKEYFESLLNEQCPREQHQNGTPNQGLTIGVTRAEVESALKKMKKNKATEPDEIPVEAWRALGVTMSYNETGTHKKRRIAHPWVFRGTASAPFVPAQGLRAHGNSLSPHPRPLSTAVLAQTIGKLPKHHASASAKSRDVNSTGDFDRYFVYNPTLTGGVLATLALCLSRHGQPAATLLKGKETVAWCAS